MVTSWSGSGCGCLASPRSSATSGGLSDLRDPPVDLFPLARPRVPPGELVGFDCFHFRRLAETAGRVWQYTAFVLANWLTPDLAVYLR